MSDHEKTDSRHVQAIQDLAQATITLERHAGKRIGSKHRILTDEDGDPLLSFSAELSWIPNQPKVQWYPLQEEVMAVLYFTADNKYSKLELKKLGAFCEAALAKLMKFLPPPAPTMPRGNDEQISARLQKEKRLN